MPNLLAVSVDLGLQMCSPAAVAASCKGNLDRRHLSRHLSLPGVFVLEHGTQTFTHLLLRNSASCHYKDGEDQAVAHDPSFHDSKMQAVVFLKLKINKKETQDQTSF